MSTDVIVELGKSVIQHGPENDRIYLMKLAPEDLPDIISSINTLAAQNSYSKAFIKVPQTVEELFAGAGYKTEAAIPGLFNGADAGLFMAHYFDDGQRLDPDAELARKVLDAAYLRAEQHHVVRLPQDCLCRLSSPAHCSQMAELYRQTFASYPFPIHDPEYLAKTMAKNVLYAGIWRGRQLLALAAAEIDHQNSNAQLTDFATDPDWRGHGLANLLLQYLEEELHLFGVKTSYTVARATSYGMNICFAQNGYLYSGTLVQNTQIGGRLESMNVWHKSLEGAEL